MSQTLQQERNDWTTNSFDWVRNPLPRVMLVGLALVSMPECFAQRADLSKFEVASIRPSVPLPGGRPCARNRTNDAGRVTRIAHP